MASGGQPPVVSRRALLRWGSWFALTNAGLAGLLGLRYLFYVEVPAEWLARGYMVVAYIGHFTFLAYLPFLLVLLPLAVTFPRRGPITALGVLIGSVGLTVLVLDTLVFAQHRFHLNALTVVLFEWSTWLFAGVLFVIGLFFQGLVARGIWRRLAGPARSRAGRRLGLVLGACWLSWHVIHVWADATYYVPVTQFSRYLPAFYGATAKRRLHKLGLVDPDSARRSQLVREVGDPDQGDLGYPAVPLSCATPSELPNILVVMIDGLRPDIIEPRITPSLHRFGESALRFERHYSGGNSSRMGVFSMFYGLPSTYWRAFATRQRSPVLVDQIQALGYQPALYSSSGFGSPSHLDRTVFAGVGGLVLERSYSGRGAYEGSIGITEAWLEFMGGRDPAQPFFGFLFYDPPNLGLPADHAPQLPPPSAAEIEGASSERLRRLQLYRQATHFVDGLVGRLLEDLRERGLWDETVVIITGDHGYELDDLGLGYFGHASNFSDYQLRTALLIHWPGREPEVFHHRSSHNDVPATLLGELFGCSNPPSDYSSGWSLFERRSWDWLVAGSYHQHAVVEPERVTVVHAGGYFEVLGPDYRPGRGIRIDGATMRLALEEMGRFYR